MYVYIQGLHIFRCMENKKMGIDRATRVSTAAVRIAGREMNSRIHAGGARNIYVRN